jgi:hypothetical protein
VKVATSSLRTERCMKTSRKCGQTHDELAKPKQFQPILDNRHRRGKLFPQF